MKPRSIAHLPFIGQTSKGLGSQLTGLERRHLGAMYLVSSTTKTPKHSYVWPLSPSPNKGKADPSIETEMAFLEGGKDCLGEELGGGKRQHMAG